MSVNGFVVFTVFLRDLQLTWLWRHSQTACEYHPHFMSVTGRGTFFHAMHCCLITVINIIITDTNHRQWRDGLV